MSTDKLDERLLEQLSALRADFAADKPGRWLAAIRAALDEARQEDRAEIERLGVELGRIAGLLLDMRERAEAAEAERDTLKEALGAGELLPALVVAVNARKEAEAKLAEAQAELAALKATWKASDAAYGGELAAERAKTTKLVEALEWMRHLASDEGRAGGSPESGEFDSAIELADAALAAAKASEPTHYKPDAWACSVCGSVYSDKGQTDRCCNPRRADAKACCTLGPLTGNHATNCKATEKPKP